MKSQEGIIGFQKEARKGEDYFKSGSSLIWLSMKSFSIRKVSVDTNNLSFARKMIL